MMFLGYTKYDMELYYAIKIYVQGHLNGDCEIMSYAAKNSYRPNLYSFWLILSKHHLYHLLVFTSGPHTSYLFTFLFWAAMYMPNVSVAVLNYFEDDLGRLVCDRSLQKVNPMHGPMFS